MNRLSFSEKQGLFEVLAQVDQAGEDILVLLTGGRAHIGAVAIAQPRPSLRDPQQISSTGSVFTLLGHKEDVVAKNMAEGLSAGLNRNVVVVAGIHWDKLAPDDIKILAELCRRLGDRITAEISQGAGNRMASAKKE
jgi:hypothetical protein